jgi:tetraacyldisaccharide 4'-kinase
MLRKILKFLGENLFTRKTPKFWEKNSFAQVILPLSVVYFLAKRLLSLLDSKPRKFKPFVICIGNVIVGGAGKTPVCMELYSQLKNKYPSKKIAIISNGYKAKNYGSLIVDIKSHTAREVGDEAYLMAQNANVIMCKDRVKAIELAEKEGFSIVILDDGLHDERVQKDFSFIVIDGKYGLGNNLILPAGPLRDRLDYAISGARDIIMIGLDEKKTADYIRRKTREEFEVHQASIKIETQPDKEKKYIAFTGIGRPQKFFDTLTKKLKLVVPKEVEYPDHHPYSEEDLEYLTFLAEEKEAQLITTEKDYVKLPKEFAKNVEKVKISAKFDNIEKLLAKIKV